MALDQRTKTKVKIARLSRRYKSCHHLLGQEGSVIQSDFTPGSDELKYKIVIGNGITLEFPADCLDFNQPKVSCVKLNK